MENNQEKAKNGQEESKQTEQKSQKEQENQDSQKLAMQQKLQEQFKQQQQQQLIHQQWMMAQMTPQQQQLMQAQMFAMQQFPQQQQQYQAALLIKNKQQQQQMQALSKQMSKDALEKEKNVNKLVKPNSLNQNAKSQDTSDASQASSIDSQTVSQNSSLYEQQALAQAKMFAEFQQKQQQQQDIGFQPQQNFQMINPMQMNQLGMVQGANQQNFNQVNPFLRQQQLIYSMQFPNQYQYQRNNFQNNQQNYQKNNKGQKFKKTEQEPIPKSSTPSDSQNNAQSSTKGDQKQSGSQKDQSYDEQYLSKQYELILKLQESEAKKDISKLEKDQQIQYLHQDLQNLVNKLVEKIQKKHESLMKSQQQLSVYQDTLKQKYNPIFQKMEDIMKEKKLEYLDHLVQNLTQNNQRIQQEKDCLGKIEKSFNEIKPKFKQILEQQMSQIKTHIDRQKQLLEQAEKDKENKKKDKEQNQQEQNQTVQSEDNKENDKKEDEVAKDKISEEPLPQIDTEKIKNATAIINQFSNVVAKNFCVYANYNDFSFANGRSSEDMNQKLTEFFGQNFSGDFQLKDSFENNVHPRIFYLEPRTKFIYSYKIMNYMTQAIMITNKFNIYDNCRYVITPQGQLFVMGGFNPQNQEFVNETYILDEYRSLLKPLNDMFYARADHVVHQFKDNIYAFGGMAYRSEAQGGKPFVHSLNTCEYYSISSQKWIMLPNFEKARQAFSVCQFNEKFIFLFGGKCLKPNARVGDKFSFDYVQEVEAFEIEKGIWRTINYINDNEKLRIIHAGAIQVSGKKIMIFGGMIENEDEDNEKDTWIDNGQTLKLSDSVYFLDVTEGSIKRGVNNHNLVTPSYYINNGGNLLCMQNKLYAQGFGINFDSQKTFLNLQDLQAPDLKAAASQNTNSSSKDGNLTQNHKKILHCYNYADQEFTEIHEGIFSSSQRKPSLHLDD